MNEYHQKEGIEIFRSTLLTRLLS